MLEFIDQLRKCDGRLAVLTRVVVMIVIFFFVVFLFVLFGRTANFIAETLVEHSGLGHREFQGVWCSRYPGGIAAPEDLTYGSVRSFYFWTFFGFFREAGETG